MEKTNRRKFLAAGLGCISAALAGGVLYPLYKYLAPRRTGENVGKFSFPESNLPADGAKFFDFSGSTFNELVRLSRDTGKVEAVPLTLVSGSRYFLDLNLPGGTGSSPLPPNGLHRATRRIASATPRTAP